MKITLNVSGADRATLLALAAALTQAAKLKGKGNQSKWHPWNDQGIRRAARDLGVCYSHLSRVLRGERHSRRLMAAYRALKQIREGRQVSVAFTQSGVTVAVCAGRWVPCDPPLRVGWVISGGTTRAFVLPTDNITVFCERGKNLHLRVDLMGRRIPCNTATVRRAKAAGLLGPAPAGGTP